MTNNLRFYEPLVPVHRRTEGTEDTVVNELKQKDSIDSGSGATVNVVSPTNHPLSSYQANDLGRKCLVERLFEM
jgi:hypothetical protein